MVIQKSDRVRMDNRKMKQQKEERRKQQKEKRDGQKKIMVTIPYMSEAVECTLRRHGIATAVRPYKTLCQLLVYLKICPGISRSSLLLVYPVAYIGETGRSFEMREKEYKKGLKQLEGVKYTRTRRKESLTEIHQSVLTDHVVRTTRSTGRE